jgi:hypothetical protein
MSPFPLFFFSCSLRHDMLPPSRPRDHRLSGWATIRSPRPSATGMFGGSGRDQSGTGQTLPRFPLPTVMWCQLAEVKASQRPLPPQSNLTPLADHNRMCDHLPTSPPRVMSTAAPACPSIDDHLHRHLTERPYLPARWLPLPHRSTTRRSARNGRARGPASPAGH